MREREAMQRPGLINNTEQYTGWRHTRRHTSPRTQYVSKPRRPTPRWEWRRCKCQSWEGHVHSTPHTNIPSHRQHRISIILHLHLPFATPLTHAHARLPLTLAEPLFFFEVHRRPSNLFAHRRVEGLTLGSSSPLGIFMQGTNLTTPQLDSSPAPIDLRNGGSRYVCRRIPLAEQSSHPLQSNLPWQSRVSNPILKSDLSIPPHETPLSAARHTKLNPSEPTPLLSKSPVRAPSQPRPSCGMYSVYSESWSASKLDSATGEPVCELSIAFRVGPSSPARHSNRINLGSWRRRRKV